MSPTRALACLGLVLGLGLAVEFALAQPGSTLPSGNLELCALWRGARGAEKATLANRLGAANGLTKNQRLAEAQPGDTRSLYRSADLQRLCRTP
jgi:hypothetical protein